MLAVLQEGLGDEGGVEVAALQLRQQSVRVELPDLLQVAEDQVRPAEDWYTYLSTTVSVIVLVSKSKLRNSTENIWLPQRGELGRELAHLELVAVSRQHQLQVVHVVHLRVEQLLDNVLTSANIGTCILIIILMFLPFIYQMLLDLFLVEDLEWMWSIMVGAIIQSLYTGEYNRPL